jgi:primary-amine oxidase
MSTETFATSTGAQPTKAVASHPLAPLSATEITSAAAIIKASWPAHTDLHFKVVTLEEPPKTEVVQYLEAEHNGTSRPSISRKAFLNYYIRNTVSVVPAQKWSLIANWGCHRTNTMRLL